MRSQRIFLQTAILTLLFSIPLQAQVGIGNTNPQAGLDISATNQATPTNEDGVLIPRIDAFPTTDPGVNQNSMLVYLTTTDGSSAPGFYFWEQSSTSWQGFGGADTQDLSIDNTVGDLSLVDGGTVEIKTIADSDDDTLIQVEEGADEDMIRIDVGGNEHFTMNSGGKLEILNTGNSVYLGDNAGVADNGTDNRMVAIGTDAAAAAVNSANITAVGYRAARLNNNVSNAVFGSGAMYNATSGGSNTVIGTFAMYFNTAAGSLNTAVGYQSMGSSSFTGGDRNTGIGGYSLYVADGQYNTGLGYGASSELEAGDNNTSVGYRAGLDTENGSNNIYLGYLAGGGSPTGGGSKFTRSNNIFIGAQSGTGESNSNKLYLENSASVTPLLYGEFDADILRVGGQLQIGASDDTTAGSVYAFPRTDGTSGQVLSTDGSGNVTWQTAAAGADTQDLSIDNTVGDLSLVDGGTVEIKTIADSDDDTLIQVEEGADEDLIRFDVAGTEKLTINTKGQLQVFNTGTSVFLGEGAGSADDLTTNRNILIGYEAGNDLTNSPNNTVVGWRALDVATNGVDNNVVIGQSSFGSLTTGSSNVSVGVGSFGSITTSNNNVAIGTNAMSNSTAGDSNVAIGRSAGANMDADDNVFIGASADSFNTGTNGQNVIIGTRAGESGVSGGAGGTNYTGRVMIGYEAGGDSNTNNTLFIENSASSTPLIGGDFTANRVGINTDPTLLTHSLTVTGNVYASGGYQTPTNTYPDYVFEDYFFGNSTIKGDYSFTPLKEAIEFVKKNGHLPNVKSYKEVKASGMKIDLGATSVKNLEKIEENFLYIAELKAENEQLTAKNKALEDRLNALEELMNVKK